MKILAFFAPLRFGIPLAALIVGFFAVRIPQDLIWNLRGAVLLAGLCYIIAKYALPKSTSTIDEKSWELLIFVMLLAQWLWLQFIVEAGRPAKDIGLLHGSVMLCNLAINGFINRYRAQSAFFKLKAG